MRVGRDSGFIKDENGKVLGISLGADYCAEHEWGIKGIQEAFGLKKYEPSDASNPGLPRRVIKKLTDDFQVFTGKNFVFMAFTNRYGTQDYKTDKEIEKAYGLYSYGKTLVTAWSERDFGVLVRDEQDRIDLQEIIKAFYGKNIAIFLGRGGPFKNGGLTFAIADRIPEKFVNDMKLVDQDTANLYRAAEKTGIKKKLEKAGKGFFALSPKWADQIKSTSGGPVETKHEVIFWLNPMEQSVNNSGWFTVEDLDLWAKGKGPILKENRA